MLDYKYELTTPEVNYNAAMIDLQETEFIPNEVCCVGAGIGGGFENTNELKVMKFKEAMQTNDAGKWQTAVDEEHDRMTKHSVWQAILRRDLPAAAKILTSTWAMKKKANGTFRARLNARGYMQVDGVHYDSASISSPVTNDVTIRIVLVIMLMAGWCGELLDIKGAFLHGDFEDGKNVYMEVPEGFDKYYDPMYYVLLLLQTIYGLKQSAMAFWRKLLMAFRDMKFKRSQADPCLYFAWTKKGLTLWISWIDDCLVVGSKGNVKRAKKKMIDRFDCDIIGNMDEYVGCKLERNYEENWVRFTQPVLIQSYSDEFPLGDETAPSTPADPAVQLMSCKEEDALGDKEQSLYRKGTGKLLHMMRWSRPEVLNPVRELSRFMKMASKAHMQALYRVLRYCVATPKRGLLLKPKGHWDGNPNYEWTIRGRSDATYASNLENRRSVTGYSVFFEEAPVALKSGGQTSVTLSSAESELASGTQCAQDMLYTMHIVESIGLKVKKPMILEMDNKGAVGICNNWSVGGRTRHVDVRQYFLRELKEEGIIVTKWLSGEDMSSDLFTKNLARPLFEKHTRVYVGEDEYMRKTRDG
jgi:histone deacetylase 1/2